MTAAVAAIGCVITAGGLPIGQVTTSSSSGNIKMGTNRLQLSTALSAKAATVAFRVLCFLPFPILKLFHFQFRIQFSFICHIRNNLLMIESPVSLLGVLGW